MLVYLLLCPVLQIGTEYRLQHLLSGTCRWLFLWKETREKKAGMSFIWSCLALIWIEYVAKADVEPVDCCLS